MDDAVVGQRYPTWRYHQTFKPTLVQTPEEEAELTPDADGWRGTPGAAAAVVTPAAKPEKKAKEGKAGWHA